MSRDRTLAALVLIALAPAAAMARGEQALRAELRASGFRIVHETLRDGNWELAIRNADGSKPVNLTRTPHVSELYPKASPDGRHIAFVAIDGAGRSKAQSVHLMKTDGSDRTLVAPHGRQPFWSPDGKTLAFTMGAEATAPEGGYENKGLYFYNIETRALSEAPRTDVAGLLAPGFTPDGQWVVASVIDGMGFHHAIAAFTVQGKEIVPLARAHWEHGRPCKNIYQCRPDVSPEGTRIAWGKDDVDNRLGGGRRSMYLEVAHIDLAAPNPRIARYTYPVKNQWPREVYHVDWSPDGKYIAFSEGSRGTGRIAGTRHALGREAPGWDIRVVRAAEPYTVVQITHDGFSNKEADWVPPVAARDGADR